MPPRARILTVEFRSLLLPPVRISLRALQLLYHPRCPSIRAPAARPPQCAAQRRHFGLYKTATARTTLGQHQVLAYKPYNVASPTDSAHEINLVRLEKHRETPIAENISLEELYEKHVKPGQLLYLTEPLPKKKAENVDKLREENLQLKHRTFGLVEAKTIPGNLKDGEKKGKNTIGALKVTPISLSSPAAYFQMALDRSYQFVEQGSPVEFSIAIKRTKLPKEERFTGAKDQSWWPWLHEHFPHLRPDFILKSMPEGSRWSVEPVSDGRHLHFVIIKPSRINKDPSNYTSRLFKVANSTETMIRKGQQQQLPMVLRQKLYDAGHNNYSPLSGMPVKQVREDEARDVISEYEETDNARTARSHDRYMPDPKPPKRSYVDRRPDTLDSSGGLGSRNSKQKKAALHEEAIQAAREIQRQETSAFEHELEHPLRISNSTGKRKW